MRRFQAKLQLATSAATPRISLASRLGFTQLFPSPASRCFSRPFSSSVLRRADDDTSSRDVPNSTARLAHDSDPDANPAADSANVDPRSTPSPALTPPEIPSGVQKPISVSPALLMNMYGPPAAMSPEADSRTGGALEDLAQSFGADFSADAGGLAGMAGPEDRETEPFHFHVYAHKHNTHVTVTRPNRDPIISLSCGNLGFKKSKRKTYDAAYQLTAYVLQRLEKTEWEPQIQRIELILRGFGHGREAAAKVLVSSEGTLWKKKIVRVADATRIKFGGTRSPNPRRI